MYLNLAGISKAFVFRGNKELTGKQIQEFLNLSPGAHGATSASKYVIVSTPFSSFYLIFSPLFLVILVTLNQ